MELALAVATIASPRMPEAFEAIILAVVMTEQFWAGADERVAGSSLVR
jgi:hypothetical protein